MLMLIRNCHGTQVVLTKEACDELAFWGENVDSLNVHCPWVPLQPPAKFVYSDASDLACSSLIDNEHKIFSSELESCRKLRKLHVEGT